ncbi:MAG: hypothetical protein ABR595_06880 [Psychroflexus sp.]
MLKSIKTYFLKRNLNSYLKTQNTSNINSNLVGVLYNADRSDKFQIRQYLEKSFQLKSDQVLFLGFSQHRFDKVEQPEDIFIEKDFSIFGEAKSENIQQFVHQKFKFLFNYYKSEQLYLDLVSSQTQVELNIGFHNSNQKLNDLMISTDIENPDFFKASSNYIKQIHIK